MLGQLSQGIAPVKGCLHHLNRCGQPYPLAMPIRVVLAGDGFIVREGIRELLRSVDEVEVVGGILRIESADDRGTRVQGVMPVS